MARFNGWSNDHKAQIVEATFHKLAEEIRDYMGFGEGILEKVLDEIGFYKQEKYEIETVFIESEVSGATSLVSGNAQSHKIDINIQLQHDKHIKLGEMSDDEQEQEIEQRNVYESKLNVALDAATYTKAEELAEIATTEEPENGTWLTVEVEEWWQNQNRANQCEKTTYYIPKEV